MGYIIQQTDDDLSTVMPKDLPDNFFVSDLESNAAGPIANAPMVPPEDGVSHAPAPQEDPADKLQQAMQRVLAERLDGVFEEVKREL